MRILLFVYSSTKLPNIARSTIGSMHSLYSQHSIIRTWTLSISYENVDILLLTVIFALALCCAAASLYDNQLTHSVVRNFATESAIEYLFSAMGWHPRLLLSLTYVACTWADMQESCSDDSSLTTIVKGEVFAMVTERIKTSPFVSWRDEELQRGDVASS
jgi:hypothetical protein